MCGFVSVCVYMGVSVWVTVYVSLRVCECVCLFVFVYVNGCAYVLALCSIVCAC